MKNIIQADSLHIPLANNSAHAVITSPPYWGQRNYGIDGQLGLETEPDCQGWATGKSCGECYVCHMTSVFREVRRVLRDDGTLWLVLGDSYNGSGGAGGDYRPGRIRGGQPIFPGHKTKMLKNKDLIGIPWRVASALQADGWWLRSRIVWHKLSPPPESVTDRPYNAHEDIFLMSKSKRYYFDQAALKELSAGSNTRFYQNVWTIASQPYKGSHFAVYPPNLVEPCILAGTSGRGCCPECGAPWERVLEDERTVDWRPTCKHGFESIPCTVLDPFNGAGTTGLVALRHNRKYVGVELNPKYIDLTNSRLKNIQIRFLSLV